MVAGLLWPRPLANPAIAGLKRVDRPRLHPVVRITTDEFDDVELSAAAFVRRVAAHAAAVAAVLRAALPLVADVTLHQARALVPGAVAGESQALRDTPARKRYEQGRMCRRLTYREP